MKKLDNVKVAEELVKMAKELQANKIVEQLDNLLRETVSVQNKQFLIQGGKLTEKGSDGYRAEVETVEGYGEVEFKANDVKKISGDSIYLK